jgi:hypothetical protein
LALKRYDLMLVLSPGARRMVEAAVERLSDVSQRAEWRVWSSANPEVKARGASDHDDRPKIPARIIAIATLALETKYADLLRQREDADEDERFYYDNDLTFINAIKKGFVREAA